MHTRTTADYSPLRGPVNDDRGRDVSGRTRYERQLYEQAVNARSDMMKLFENRTTKAKKKPKMTRAERRQRKTKK